METGLLALVVRDNEDVVAASLANQLGRQPAVPDLLPARAGGVTDDDLRDVAFAGEAQDGLHDVAAFATEMSVGWMAL